MPAPRWQTANREELRRRPEAAPAVKELARRTARGTLTLVYPARDTGHNNAVVLREAFDATRPTRSSPRSTRS